MAAPGDAAVVHLPSAWLTPKTIVECFTDITVPYVRTGACRLAHRCVLLIGGPRSASHVSSTRSEPRWARISPPIYRRITQLDHVRTGPYQSCTCFLRVLKGGWLQPQDDTTFLKMPFNVAGLFRTHQPAKSSPQVLNAAGRLPGELVCDPAGGAPNAVPQCREA